VLVYTGGRRAGAGGRADGHPRRTRARGRGAARAGGDPPPTGPRPAPGTAGGGRPGGPAGRRRRHRRGLGAVDPGIRFRHQPAMVALAGRRTGRHAGGVGWRRPGFAGRAAHAAPGYFARSVMTTTRVQPISEPLDTSKTVFDMLGGEPGVRELVDRFYDLMDMESDFKALRDAHGPSLEQARDKLFWFLCGYFGGPDHYIERFGHPRLRARHLPFSIGEIERDQWVACMGRAMQDQQLPPALVDRLLQAFYGTADWMRNRAG